MTTVQSTNQNTSTTNFLSSSNLGGLAGSAVGLGAAGAGIYKVNKTLKPVKEAIKTTQDKVIPAIKQQEDVFQKFSAGLIKNREGISKELESFFENKDYLAIFEDVAQRALPETQKSLTKLIEALASEEIPNIKDIGAILDTRYDLTYLKEVLSQNEVLKDSAEAFIANLDTLKPANEALKNIQNILIANKDAIFEQKGELLSGAVDGAKEYLKEQTPQTYEAIKALKNTLMAEFPDKETTMGIIEGLSKSEAIKLLESLPLNELDKETLNNSIAIIYSSKDLYQETMASFIELAYNSKGSGEEIINALKQTAKKQQMAAYEEAIQLVKTKMPQTYEAALELLKNGKEELNPASISNAIITIAKEDSPSWLKNSPQTQEFINNYKEVIQTTKQTGSMFTEIFAPVVNKLKSIDFTNPKMASELLSEGCQAVKKTTNKYMIALTGLCVALIPAGFGIGTLVDKSIAHFKNKKR